MGFLHPRFVSSEFTPMFRLLDDYAAHVGQRSNGCAVRSWQPRFDVKENKEAYELQGELPGVDQENISIEFTDVNTLSIKGRTERRREEGTRPTAAPQVEAAAAQQVETEVPQQAVTEGETNSETSSYHKPTVEEEDGVVVDANPEAEASTEAATEAAAEPTPASTEAGEAAEAPKQERSRYWVSERSVGQFQRTFSFSARVDQDKVKASLKDGILSIVVPKAAIPENKRINIE